MTGDANASNGHKRGQARDMVEGELEPVHRRMEGKGKEGKQLMLGVVLPSNQGQGMTGK